MSSRFDPNYKQILILAGRPGLDERTPAISLDAGALTQSETPLYFNYLI